MATSVVAVAGREAQAQTPTRLPEVVIKADPGPNAIAGFVKDTSGSPLADVEIIIAEFGRRTKSRQNGSFRIDDLPRGTHDVLARKIGYAPQVIKIKVDKM